MPRQSPLAINQRPPPPALRRPPTSACHLQDNGVSTGDVRDVKGVCTRARESTRTRVASRIVGCTALAHTAAAAAEIEQPARPARIAVDELALDVVVEPLELEGRALCFRRGRGARRFTHRARHVGARARRRTGTRTDSAHLLALAKRVLPRARGGLGVRVVVALSSLDLVEVHRGRRQAALRQKAHHVGVQRLEAGNLPEPQQRGGREDLHHTTVTGAVRARTHAVEGTQPHTHTPTPTPTHPHPPTAQDAVPQTPAGASEDPLIRNPFASTGACTPPACVLLLHEFV